MTQQDSRSEPPVDRTIVIPSPGRRPDSPQQTPAPSSMQLQLPRVSLEALDWQTGINPLIAAANPLLGMVPRLRQARHPDPAGLRETLAQAVSLFEAKAAAAGVPHEQVVAARYALCTFLDEAAANTPWGEKVWAQRSLLVQFHNEAWGGEKFFLLLGKLAERPAQQRDLLELFYLILALGFEGRYRVLENGRAQLAGVRERLAQMIARERGPLESELSPQWRGSAGRKAALHERLPLWVSAAVAALLLALVYALLSFALNRKSDLTFSAILALRAEAAPPAALAAKAPDRLAHLLAAEIAAGTLEVRDLSDRSIVVARGDQLFEPGSATVSPAFERLLLRIGEAAASTGGSVLVLGHTDDRPIRSVRYPSNWHLSQARADAAARLLLPRLADPSRLRTEGRADSEPVASNQTAEGRASNRRVEIVVYAGSGQ
jgi:type VI secretion system protein ImpK